MPFPRRWRRCLKGSEMKTFNIQHSTSNIQLAANVRCKNIGCSTLNVECSMFPFAVGSRHFSFFCFRRADGFRPNQSLHGFGPVQITLGTNNGPQDVDTGIKVLAMLTLLTLAPSIMLLMTVSRASSSCCRLFARRCNCRARRQPDHRRAVAVPHAVHHAAGLGRHPARRADAVSGEPDHSQQAIDRASAHIRTFMLRQARPKDVELFAQMAKLQPTKPDELPLRVVIPASSSANCARRSRWAS